MTIQEGNQSETRETPCPVYLRAQQASRDGDRARDRGKAYERQQAVQPHACLGQLSEADADHGHVVHGLAPAEVWQPGAVVQGCQVHVHSVQVRLLVEVHIAHADTDVGLGSGDGVGAGHKGAEEVATFLEPEPMSAPVRKC